MVWGVMNRQGLGPIHRVDSSMNQQWYIKVLEEDMLPAAFKQFRCNFIFQQDNAPCHKAGTVTSCFKDHEIQTLTWPPQSPDLSPIENLWEGVSHGLRFYKPTNLDDFWLQIQHYGMQFLH